MKRWFKFVWKYPNGADAHHNIWIAWQVCACLICMSFMEQAKSSTEYRILWWLSLLAIFNGVVLVIHYECFVKPDYWRPKDKKK